MSDDLEIEFFFDIASPYSYLASTQVGDLEEETGVPVRWCPFLLGGVLKAAGNAPPARVQAKAEYMLKDLNRWADRYGIRFEMPSIFPINSLTAQRVLVAVGEADAGMVPDLAHRLFRAYWVEDVDVSDEEAIGDFVDEVGLSGSAIVTRADEPEIKEKLRANSDEAVDRGAFGAPTFFVGDEMFWGNDRMDFVRKAVEQKAGT